MKIRRGKDIKLRWSVTVNDRPITADDDLTLVLINPRLEKIKLDYFIEDGALVFYFRGKEQKFLGEYKLTLWLNYGKENQTALDDTSCFTLVRFTDDEDNDLEDITEVELKGSVTISGDSAYEIWLKNGNSGTQTDFLESLKGADGKQGIDGKDGLDANSAIEVVNQETNSAAQKGAINVKSTGINSIAGGIKSYATGNYSLAFGRHNIAEGRGSIALGGTLSSKTFTGKGGDITYTTNIEYYYLDVVNSGLYVWDSSEGNDKEPAKTVSAVVDEETNTLIVTLDRTLSDTDITDKSYGITFNHATGSSAIAMGGKAVGNSATCLGTFNYAKGTTTAAIGNGNSIDGQSGLVCGNRNKAIGNYTYSFGRANYNGSPFDLTIGYKNIATGQYSMGFGCYANAQDGGVNFSYAAGSYYISSTDTPCKYILEKSVNIDHNKMLSALKGSYVIKPETAGTLNIDDKQVLITNAEFIDGVYYIYTEEELKAITTRTQVVLMFPSNGNGSLVFGRGAAAQRGSITLGEYNIANAYASFTAGFKNVVEGEGSIGLGIYLNTTNEGEVALGECNKSNNGATKAEQTLFSVGNGDKDGDKLDAYGWVDLGNGGNALEIMRNNDIYLGGYGDGVKLYDGENNKLNIIPTTITNGTGTNSSLQVNAYNCEASGTNSIATGVKSIANGNYSIAMGRFNEAKGRGSVAMGGFTKSFNFTGVAGATTYTTDITDSHLQAIISGIRFYPTTEANDDEFWTVVNAEMIDDVVHVTLDRTINADSDITNKALFALLNVAIGNNSIALGGIAKGSNSVCAGALNVSSGIQSVALGNGNQSKGTCSFTAGFQNEADGQAALAMGQKNKTVGSHAIAIGYANEATEPVAVAIGNKNTVSKQSAIGIGVLNDSIGSSSVAIGYKNKAHHHGTVTLGGYTTATNQGEVAVGIGNISHSGTRFSVGGGNELLNYDASTNKNLLEIMSNGDIWIGNYNEGKKLWDVATGTSPLVEEIVNKILIEKGVTNG